MDVKSIMYGFLFPDVSYNAKKFNIMNVLNKVIKTKIELICMRRSSRRVLGIFPPRINDFISARRFKMLLTRFIFI